MDRAPAISVGVRYKGVRGDDDKDFFDKRTHGYIDRDDQSIVGLGSVSDAQEKRVVAALLDRFYAAARRGDGATACRLEYSLFGESIPEDYGRRSGLPYAQGKTCAVVMSKVFRHSHSLTLARYRVVSVIVKGNFGYALLGSRHEPASYMNLRRERGTWKVVGLLASPLP